jgi:hypothetical protein
LEKIKNTEIEEVEKLEDTSRESKGFRSSGIREVQIGTLDKEIKKSYQDFKIDMNI